MAPPDFAAAAAMSRLLLPRQLRRQVTFAADTSRHHFTIDADFHFANIDARFDCCADGFTDIRAKARRASSGAARASAHSA